MAEALVMGTPGIEPLSGSSSHQVTWRLLLSMAFAFGVVLVASTRTLASGATPKSNASDKATSTIERADKKTQESDERPIEPAALGATEETQEKQVKYSRKGLEIKGRDGNYTTRINWRSQLRYSYPFDAAPRNSEGFDKEEVRDFGFRRARFKAKGAVFRPWTVTV